MNTKFKPINFCKINSNFGGKNMSWTVLTFGKHKGRTLPQVVICDLPWFYWAIEDNIFKDKGKLFDEAQELYSKTKKIRISQNGGKKLYADYITYKNKLHAMEIVSNDRPVDIDIRRKNHIDLSTSREIDKNDKKGCKILVDDFKKFKFGHKSYKMTKKRCEEFFENDDNFDL